VHVMWNENVKWKENEMKVLAIIMKICLMKMMKRKYNNENENNVVIMKIIMWK